MDNLTRILNLYEESDSVSRICDSLKKTSEKQRILVEGSAGAHHAFILLGTRKKSKRSQVFVAMDKEEAAYLQNTLDNLHPERPVHFLPDSFKRPLQFEEVNNHNVQQRTETINQVYESADANEIVVTYPEALFEKVVNPRLIDDERIELQTGESLDLDTILELLVEYGFESVEYVYEPGQFSIRGGIVDIFSYGNEWPYRIELFDDEVESIRMFNPLTQLSMRNI